VPQGYSIVNGNLQSFPPGRQPQIGDVIIEFRALYPDTGTFYHHQSQFPFRTLLMACHSSSRPLPPLRIAPVSIVAKVRRGELVAYQTRAGDSLAMIKIGAESAEKMFQEAEDWNTFRTWALRGLGLFLMFVSFNMILSPVASVFGIVPLLGPLLQSIVGAGVAIAAAGLAISVSALICAVAWLWYRPFVSIALLVAALVPIYLLPKRGAAVVHPRAPGENFARND
jgi:hypothetical protein